MECSKHDHFSCFSFALWQGKSSAIFPSCMLSIMVYYQWVYGLEQGGSPVVIQHFLVCSTHLYISSCIFTIWWRQWDLNIKSIFGGNVTWPIFKWFSSLAFFFTAVNFWSAMIVTIQQRLDTSLQRTLFCFLCCLRNFILKNT